MVNRKPNTVTQAVRQQKKEEKRKFVRLDVFSPVNFNSIIVDSERKVRLHPEKKSGLLLNLSAGGVLLTTTDTVAEGEFTLMKFQIKGFDTLTDVLGKVKRVDAEEAGEFLVGIEFLSLEHVDDPEIAAGLRRLIGNPNEFSQGLSRMVSRYVFARQVEMETE